MTTCRATLVGAAALGAGIFTVLAIGYSSDPVADLDTDVSEWVARVLPSWAEWAARPFSWLGGWIGLTLLGIIATVLLLRERAWSDLAFLLGVIALSQLLSNGLKPVFDRARPHTGSPIAVPVSGAFPSGHAAAATACLGALALVVSARIASRSVRIALWTVTALLAIGIAASRVALNVHWLSDVVAGAALGIALLAVAVLLLDASGRR